MLEEVCDDKMFLESLVAAKGSLLGEEGQRALARLGARGRILLTRSQNTFFSFMYVLISLLLYYFSSTDL